MKFKELGLKNYKGIKEKQYIPKNKIAVLIGENGKGKTSFTEGLRTAITGVFNNEDIMTGESVTETYFYLDDADQTSIHRVYQKEKANKLWLNGKASQVKKANEYLETQIHTSIDSAKITTSSEVLDNLDAADFGSFIMKYVPNEIDLDTILSYVSNPTQEKKEMISNALQKEDGITMDDVKAVFDFFADKNKLLKREIKQKEARLKYTNEELLDMKPSRNLSEIQKDLEEIIRQQGKVEENKKLQKMYKKNLEIKAFQEKQIVELEDRITNHPGKKINEASKQVVLDKMKEQMDKIKTIQTSIATFSSNIKMFEKSLKTLEQKTCPLSEYIVCTTDKTSAREEITALLEGNKEQKEKQENLLLSEREIYDKLSKKKEDFIVKQTSYDEKVRLQKDLDALKKNQIKVLEMPDKLNTKDLQELKDALEKEKKQILEYSAQIELMNQIILLKDKQNTMEILKKGFSPKGEITDKITRYYLDDFEAVCNDIADDLGSGYELKLEFNQGVEILVKTNSSSDFLKINQLSEGEKLMVTFIILDMLNSLTNLRILILDNLDRLDEHNFELILNLIQTPPVQDAYDHIFLSMVNHQHAKDMISKIPNIDYIY